MKEKISRVKGHTRKCVCMCVLCGLYMLVGWLNSAIIHIVIDLCMRCEERKHLKAQASCILGVLLFGAAVLIVIGWMMI